MDVQKVTCALVSTEFSTRNDNVVGTQNFTLCADSLTNNLRSENRLGTRNLSDSSTGGTTLVDTSSSSGVGSISSLTMPTMVASEIALKALTKAESILTLRHVFARLNDIWGVPAGPRTTKILIKKIRLLLNSYINSGDIVEATELILGLDAPHFLHELVYQVSCV